MAKVFADQRFVGVWKCTTKIKEVIFNNEKLNFPDKQTKIVSFSNTPGGTVMFFGQPGPEAKGIPVLRASGIGIEIKYAGKSSKYILNETIKINIIDNANLLGESILEWQIPGKGPVAKIIARSEYHRVGRMRSG